MNMQRTLTLLYGLLLSSTLLWAQTEPRLGVNTPTPQHTLDVNGAINIAPDSAYQINGTPVLRTQLVTSFGNPFTNLYLGPQAGQNNTIGRFNHFSGFQAGLANTTGSFNYFSGYQAGLANTTGGNNHFSGFRAGTRNTTGGANHFSGLQAGQNNTTGSGNYFSGFSAGSNNTTGNANHFSGYQAGFFNTTGENNHFSGFLAGLNNTTGNENVYIGYRAGVIGNYTNAIAIGANVSARGNNTVTIGNSNHTSIGGYQPWSNLSDGRFKREVAEDVPGLEFVTRLRPVSYRVDRAALQDFLHREEGQSQQSLSEQPRETGFIAQEVEKVAKSINYDFNGIIRPQSEQDHYQLSYATFVVPLVQAVQEQQALIEKQQTQIEALQAKVAQFKKLESRLQVLERGSSSPTDALSQ